MNKFLGFRYYWLIQQSPDESVDKERLISTVLQTYIFKLNAKVWVELLACYNRKAKIEKL